MNVVIKVDEETKQKMINYYQDKRREKTPPYALFQAQEEDTIITLYESGKAMFQGTSADVDASMWQSIQKVDDKKSNTTSYYYLVDAIGSDEVGTGDYFGPIIVTASYVTKENIPFLEKLGVKDSKKLTDELILKIAPEIIQKIPHKTIKLSNEEYNASHTTSFNINKMKAILHNKVLLEMKQMYPNCNMIIVDEFAKENRYYSYLEDAHAIQKGITFITKAEDKNLAVASSSIISRYYLLKEFDRISDFYHLPIPKGAGANVDQIGMELVEKYGKEILDKIAKKNFANTQKILKTRII